MKKGVYNWQVPNFNGGYLHFTTSVEIFGETEKSYLVKFLNAGPYGARPGRITYVRKKSVQLEGATPIIHSLANYSRLPYKD